MTNFMTKPLYKLNILLFTSFNLCFSLIGFKYSCYVILVYGILAHYTPFGFPMKMQCYDNYQKTPELVSENITPNSNRLFCRGTDHIITVLFYSKIRCLANATATLRIKLRKKKCFPGSKSVLDSFTL